MKSRNHVVGAFLLLAFGTVLLPSIAWANFCIGENCGALREGFHCHSVNAAGVECWDMIDDMCETVAGFSRVEAAPCTDGAVVGAVGVAGGLATQIPTIGGINIFRGQIRQTAIPRMSVNPPTTQDDGEEKSQGGFFASNITTNLEHEQWDYFGLEGETNGINLGWQRQTERGHLFGFNGSYQEAKPDSGPSVELINASFNYGHTLGGNWKWSVNATANNISGIVDETLVGGGGQLYYNKYFDNGAVFSGGVVAQIQTADELDDDLKTVGYGLAYGFPIGQRFALDFEGFGVSILDTDLDDDMFFTLGSMFSVYFTPRFTLTLGYRVLEGIDELSSDTITLGSSTRW